MACSGRSCTTSELCSWLLESRPDLFFSVSGDVGLVSKLAFHPQANTHRNCPGQSNQTRLVRGPGRTGKLSSATLPQMLQMIHGFCGYRL